ncbi:serine protease family protein [Pseudomonas sp. S2_B07]
MTHTENNAPHEKIEAGINLELPTMKSLYIEMYFGETLLSSGTAFLVARDQQSHCCLFTNKHNVTGRKLDTGECLSSNAAIPDNIVIYFHQSSDQPGSWLKIKLPLYRDDGSPYWFEHPTLGEIVDAVALNLSWGSDVWKMPYYLNPGLDRHGLFVSPSETVSVIGFPFGLSVAGKFPIWATGFLAQDLSLLDPKNPYFLIDCRTHQGQSGSAVVAYRTTQSRKKVGDRVSTIMSGNTTWEFLGIYAGRVNAESDLGRVWHVSALEEIFSVAEKDNQEREAKAALRAAQSE